MTSSSVIIITKNGSYPVSEFRSTARPFSHCWVVVEIQSIFVIVFVISIPFSPKSNSAGWWYFRCICKFCSEFSNVIRPHCVLVQTSNIFKFCQLASSLTQPSFSACPGSGAIGPCFGGQSWISFAVLSLSSQKVSFRQPVDSLRQWRCWFCVSKHNLATLRRLFSGLDWRRHKSTSESSCPEGGRVSVEQITADLVCVHVTSCTKLPPDCASTRDRCQGRSRPGKIGYSSLNVTVRIDNPNTQLLHQPS